MNATQEGPTGRPGNGALKALAFGVAIAVIITGALAVARNLAGGGEAAHTVTYAVDGGPADVTYGPAGSQAGHGSPMSVTAPLGGAAWYAATAQLAGYGSVTCAISVDGTVVSRASATGAYRVAQCEIIPDGNGGWRSATGG
jgi:hypothetical protein